MWAGRTAWSCKLETGIWSGCALGFLASEVIWGQEWYDDFLRKVKQITVNLLTYIVYKYINTWIQYNTIHSHLGSFMPATHFREIINDEWSSTLLNKNSVSYQNYQNWCTSFWCWMHPQLRVWCPLEQRKVGNIFLLHFFLSISQCLRIWHLHHEQQRSVR